MQHQEETKTADRLPEHSAAGHNNNNNNNNNSSSSIIQSSDMPEIVAHQKVDSDSNHKEILEGARSTGQQKECKDNRKLRVLKIGRDGAKVLDRYTSSCQLKAKVHPISLKIFPKFFCKENHLSFSNFLAGFGSRLQEMEIGIPHNGGSMIFLFSRVHLAFPNLQKVTIKFCPDPIKRKKKLFGSIRNALYLIQPILTGAKNLGELNLHTLLPKTKLTNSRWDACNNIPPGICYLSLPPSIISLDVSSFSSLDLNAILKYNLPCLQKLRFSIYSDQINGEGVVSKILEKFSTSLVSLVIEDRDGLAWKFPNLFQFPLMQKLERCTFRNDYAQLEKLLPPLHQPLPNLKEPSLESGGITQLTDSCSISNVTQFNFSADEMQRFPSIKIAFPNIRDLTLQFIGSSSTFFNNITNTSTTTTTT